MAPEVTGISGVRRGGDDTVRGRLMLSHVTSDNQYSVER